MITRADKNLNQALNRAKAGLPLKTIMKNFILRFISNTLALLATAWILHQGVWFRSWHRRLESRAGLGTFERLCPPGPFISDAALKYFDAGTLHHLPQRRHLFHRRLHRRRHDDQKLPLGHSRFHFILRLQHTLKLDLPRAPRNQRRLPPLAILKNSGAAVGS